MNNFIYIMGKSATGKDTIYSKLKENINSYVLYTTRPMREGEQEGIDYHYVTAEKIEELQKAGKIIESRTYNTIYGPWTYATVKDEQLEQEGDIVTVGTLESYERVKEYFRISKETKVLPVYISIDEKTRRKRATEREKRQKEPKYDEMERRLKADNIDFSEENLRKCGITEGQTFYNYNLERCVNDIQKYIQKSRENEKER